MGNQLLLSQERSVTIKKGELAGNGPCALSWGKTLSRREISDGLKRDLKTWWLAPEQEAKIHRTLQTKPSLLLEKSSAGPWPEEDMWDSWEVCPTQNPKLPV